jgi:hypothetical protein
MPPAARGLVTTEKKISYVAAKLGLASAAPHAPGRHRADLIATGPEGVVNPMTDE